VLPPPLHLLLGRLPRVAPSLPRPYFSPLLPSSVHATTSRATASRHIVAAVDSSLQKPRALTPARSSTTSTPANYSSCAFAVSPTPDPSSTAASPCSHSGDSCSPWAAHSKPSRTTTTPQLDSFQPREALRPLHWFPSAPHRLPDARRRLPPPPSSLSAPVAPNPKLMFPIGYTSTFPTTHWSSCAGPSPTSAAGASPSSLTPPPPLRAPIEIPLPGHLYPRHVVQSNRREPLKLPLPSDLAAGGPPRRNTAV
jgi:hypothetical protein